jgi:hypothetical protein
MKIKYWMGLQEKRERKAHLIHYIDAIALVVKLYRKWSGWKGDFAGS